MSPLNGPDPVSLEQRVAAVLNGYFDDGVETSIYGDAECAAEVIALCRGAIADEIETERKKLNVPDNDWPENGAMSDVVVSDTLGFAARVARGPVAPPDLSSAFPVVGGPLEPEA